MSRHFEFYFYFSVFSKKRIKFPRLLYICTDVCERKGSNCAMFRCERQQHSSSWRRTHTRPCACTHLNQLNSNTKTKSIYKPLRTYSNTVSNEMHTRHEPNNTTNRGIETKTNTKNQARTKCTAKVRQTVAPTVRRYE